MYYAILEGDGEWIELERSTDQEYLLLKYPFAEIIGGW